MEKIEELLEKDTYNFNDLRDIIKILRSENGCPWDREQTHESIRKNFIEETYEVIEAIDNKDTVLLREELGDVLLQIMFHSLIEEEKGEFSIDEVCNDICKKLIMRHPHIFSNNVASTITVNEVLNNWDIIKKTQKKQSTNTEVLESISKALPSLMRADKIGHKAAKAGFDFESSKSALEKVQEKLDGIKLAIENGDTAKIEKEIGYLLFATTHISRKYGIDSEHALFDACDKFVSEFNEIENNV